MTENRINLKQNQIAGENTTSLYILTSFPPLKSLVKVYAAKEMVTGRGKDLRSLSASRVSKWNFRSGIHREKREK